MECLVVCMYILGSTIADCNRRIVSPSMERHRREEFHAVIVECWNKAHHKSVSRADFCRRSLNLIRTPSRRVAQRACGVERTGRQLVRHLPSP